MFLLLLLSLALIGLSGCSEKDNAKSDDSKKTTETDSKKTTESDSKKPTASDSKATDSAADKESEEPESTDKEVTDFVLENTKIVKISNISKRTHELHPDLGPFFVVRGIDLRGQTSEIWIKDMKIFEMVTQANN
jgi:hypothetical protein